METLMLLFVFDTYSKTVNLPKLSTWSQQPNCRKLCDDDNVGCIALL